MSFLEQSLSLTPYSLLLAWHSLCLSYSSCHDWGEVHAEFQCPKCLLLFPFSPIRWLACAIECGNVLCLCRCCPTVSSLMICTGARRHSHFSCLDISTTVCLLNLQHYLLANLLFNHDCHQDYSMLNVLSRLWMNPFAAKVLALWSSPNLLTSCNETGVLTAIGDSNTLIKCANSL